MNDRTGTGRARYRKWDHLHRVQFRYRAQWMSVPELAKPGTRNGITCTESSSGTGPNEWPYRNWQSPVPETGRNESRSFPVLVNCAFWDCMIRRFSRNGPPKRMLLEMGPITGNGSAISSTGKLRVLGLTFRPIEFAEEHLRTGALGRHLLYLFNFFFAQFCCECFTCKCAKWIHWTTVDYLLNNILSKIELCRLPPYRQLMTPWHPPPPSSTGTAQPAGEGGGDGDRGGGGCHKPFGPKPGIVHSQRGRGMPTLTWEEVTIEKVEEGVVVE
jgi:hypothetical protein